jgi:hypothetical protein
MTQKRRSTNPSFRSPSAARPSSFWCVCFACQLRLICVSFAANALGRCDEGGGADSAAAARRRCGGHERRGALRVSRRAKSAHAVRCVAAGCRRQRCRRGAGCGSGLRRGCRAGGVDGAHAHQHLGARHQLETHRKRSLVLLVRVAGLHKRKSAYKLYLGGPSPSSAFLNTKMPTGSSSATLRRAEQSTHASAHKTQKDKAGGCALERTRR